MEGDGFLFKASLKNNNIPELGTVTVEFPIPEAQYEETIRALNGIQSGAVVEQDCFVADIGTADCPALERLIGTMANVDELDWLGKQLESFDRYELLQFNAAAERFGLSSVGECRQAASSDASHYRCSGRTGASGWHRNGTAVDRGPARPCDAVRCRVRQRHEAETGL